MTIKKQNAMHAREFKRKQQLLLKRNQSLVAQRGQCQIKLAFSVISRINFYKLSTTWTFILKWEQTIMFFLHKKLCSKSLETGII